MSFFLTLLAVALVVGTLYVQALRKKDRLSGATWEQLVRQLEEVPMIGITKVALNYLQPSKSPLTIQTDEMWHLVGGAEGLKRMQTNAEVLLQLAAYAEQWNPQEGIIVGEMMRREALLLRRAVGKVHRGLIWGYGMKTGPFCVQEAASTYYLMRLRLLSLYEISHVGRHGRLSIALGNGMGAYGPAL